jgi:hypothetical protein
MSTKYRPSRRHLYGDADTLAAEGSGGEAQKFLTVAVWHQREAEECAARGERARAEEYAQWAEAETDCAARCAREAGHYGNRVLDARDRADCRQLLETLYQARTVIREAIHDDRRYQAETLRNVERAIVALGGTLED